MTFSLTAEDLQERWRLLRAEIADSGGSPERVQIVAVTKTFPPEAAALAARVGLLDLGENYGQELEAKAPAVAKLLASSAATPRWHFIGGLQRNKVKRIASLVSLWQTVDRVDLAQEISKRAAGASVLIQVNTTAEEQKSGCRPLDAAMLVDSARSIGLDVRGLMTVGPTDGSDPRPAFAQLRSLADRLGLVECSMGMSGDVAAAVAEGSTMVRVGTRLFGPRPPGAMPA